MKLNSKNKITRERERKTYSERERERQGLESIVGVSRERARERGSQAWTPPTPK